MEKERMVSKNVKYQAGWQWRTNIISELIWFLFKLCSISKNLPNNELAILSRKVRWKQFFLLSRNFGVFLAGILVHANYMNNYWKSLNESWRFCWDPISKICKNCSLWALFTLLWDSPATPKGWNVLVVNNVFWYWSTFQLLKKRLSNLKALRGPFPIFALYTSDQQSGDWTRCFFYNK